MTFQVTVTGHAKQPDPAEMANVEAAVERMVRRLEDAGLVVSLARVNDAHIRGGAPAKPKAR